MLLSASSFVVLSFAVSLVRAGITCDSWFSVATVSGSFTLLAVSADDSTVQRPLGLGVIPGYQEGVAVIAAVDTITHNLATNFTLTNSSVVSVSMPGSKDSYLSMYVATNSGLLEYMSKAKSATGWPVASYCEEFNTSPHGVEYPYTLDVYNDSGSFSLCSTWNATDGAKGPTDIIVYTPQNGTALPYNGATCKPVYVHMLHDSN